MNNRKIGKVGELDALRFWRRWWPDAKRGFQQRGGDEMSDIINTPFWVEVKAHNSIGDKRVEDFYYKATNESNGQSVIVQYKHKNKSRKHRKKYVRFVMCCDLLKEFESQAKHYDHDEWRILGEFNRLVEVTPEYLGFLFDLIYGGNNTHSTPNH
ncbi:MAG: hypothetical protein ACFFCW_01925 [Candidatus Hodarchaeota archaeon]